MKLTPPTLTHTAHPLGVSPGDSFLFNHILPKSNVYLHTLPPTSVLATINLRDFTHLTYTLHLFIYSFSRPFYLQRFAEQSGTYYVSVWVLPGGPNCWCNSHLALPVDLQNHIISGHSCSFPQKPNGPPPPSIYTSIQLHEQTSTPLFAGPVGSDRRGRGSRLPAAWFR